MAKPKFLLIPAALSASILFTGTADSATLEFQLLTWNDASDSERTCASVLKFRWALAVI